MIVCHVGIRQTQVPYLCHIVLCLTFAVAKTAWLQKAAAVTLHGMAPQSTNCLVSCVHDVRRLLMQLGSPVRLLQPMRALAYWSCHSRSRLKAPHLVEFCRPLDGLSFTLLRAINSVVGCLGQHVCLSLF